MKLRHLLLSTLVALMASATAMAQDASTVTLGFCNGKNSLSSDYNLGKKGWTHAAVRIPASTVQAYAGNAITTLRAALANRSNCDTLRLWVRTSLDGENLAEATTTSTTAPYIVRKWNQLELAEPLQLTGEEGDLYIGYSLHHLGAVAAVSMVQPAIPNSSYVKLGDNGWSNESNNGTVSIEALVVGTNFKQFDLSMGSASVSPNADGLSYKVTAVVTNLGTADVAGYSITAAPGSGTPEGVTETVNEVLQSGHSSVVTFTVDNPSGELDLRTPWLVSVAPDAETDEDTDNNAVTAQFTFLRNPLVEEFTTEVCPNCPRVAGWLHNILDKEPYKSRIVAVCHHSAYYTDSYTKPCDTSYTWFFNDGGSTYAPAIMLDRNNDYGESNTPVFLPGSQAGFQTMMDDALDRPANLFMVVNTSVNEDSTQVFVTVTGQKNDFYSSANPCLNVQVTEDNIATTSQSGASGTFYHQHVTRDYNSTWGDQVEWDENGQFTMTYTFNLAENWKKEDLKVIAWVYNYDSSNPTNCKVDNAAQTVINFASDEPANPADINADGVVDASDVTALIDVILNGGENGDVNGDGVVDAGDVTALIDIVLGN